MVHRYQCIDIFIPFCAAREHSGDEDEVLETEQQDDLNEGAQDNFGRQSSLHPMYVSTIHVYKVTVISRIALGFHQQSSFISASVYFVWQYDYRFVCYSCSAIVL